MDTDLSNISDTSKNKSSKFHWNLIPYEIKNIYQA